MKLSEALKITQAIPDPSAQKFPVYLACGILPLHLTTFLAAHLSQRMPDRAIEIQNGLYGDLTGNLEQLKKSSARAAVVIVEWSDLDPRLGLRRLGGWGPSTLPDIHSGVQQTTNQLLELIAAVAQSMPVALSLPTVPLPPISYQPGEQSGLDNLRLQKALADFSLSAAEIPHVKIVSAQRLDAISPISERLDVKSELSTGFPYRTSHASMLAELLSHLIHPRAPKKGLITDLDDTLWRGLVGEEGANGVSWELDRRSHIHALYQQVLRALSESGVLIAVASKNDPALVREALTREDLIVPADSLFPIEVNWGPKSQSIGRILETWNINADAVVFVDDSALELAEVTSIYPKMECLRFPVDDEQSAYQLLEKLRDLFGKQNILTDDVIRAASVRSGSQFQQNVQTESARPLADFLKEVDAELTVGAVSNDDARAFELVNKTNQFNLNGRRLDEGEFQSALTRPNAVSLIVSYNDKYGPLGKIAVLMGQLESSSLKVDTWVMSCRAFSRYIEHRCLQLLFDSLDIAEIELEYRATERNGPVREFLAQFLDVEAMGPYKLQRDTFMNRKPALSHKIKEVK